MQRRHPDNWTASSLNDSNCLSLKQIVGSFSAPITEEHAWAVGKKLLCNSTNFLSNKVRFYVLISYFILVFVIQTKFVKLHYISIVQDRILPRIIKSLPVFQFSL